MTQPLIIIRPEPGASATMESAVRAGWTVIKEPLFHVRPVQWALADDAQYDALLAGSANAFRHGGHNLADLVHLPVYAVGEKTAALARKHGFSVRQGGNGGLSSLLPTLKNDGKRRILWLSAHDYVPLPAHDTQIDRVEVYASEAAPMPDTLAETLRQPAIIALHSARAATHFREQAICRGINIAQISLACFAPRIAEAADEGWAKIATAKSPNDEAMLEVAAQLCKT
ncbi:uroporphyrinogen-III synthase [Sphingorhabdus sp. Alg239-R122]|uniref:uroporphyrinogen-III synthase n=1 Tax=Sphingorhabdus sp. Alg239-R122 TaxID=2305989 RepID=UPI0013DC84B9|nr:uroporphyrinogen-III synthase [Sphingorhabdus sp. Alg239-R122]